MGVLSRLKNWFAPQQLRAKVDAAQTTDHNSEHWAMADALSADAAYTLAVRKKVRERARYEFLNNPICRGIVRTHANAVIGTGPRLQVRLKSDNTNRQIEEAWHRWCKARRIAEKLRTMRMAQIVDGEAFALLGSGKEFEGVELDVYPIESDQVTTGYGVKQLTLVGQPDGIELDADGNIVRYHILNHHPGDTFKPVPYEARSVPPSQVIHLYRAERPGQHRGLSELTPALPLFAVLRRYTMATLMSAETAASIAGILRTNSTAIDPAEVDAWEAVAIRHGALVTVPDGWSMEQFKAENPHTGYEAFKRAIIAEIARCLNMPYNVAAADSSGHNYSSGRLDHQVYGKEVYVDQDYYERECLNRIFAQWLEEAVLAGQLPVSALGAADVHEWHWDPLEDIDPQKTAGARQLNLATGMTSYATEFAVDGRDWRTEWEKQAECLGMTFEEFQAAQRLKAFPPQPMQAPAAGAPGAEGEAADNQPTAEFGGLSRLQWQRNRKAIRDVLDGLISGNETPASAQLFLESIGLSPDKAQALIEDAADSQIDDPELQASLDIAACDGLPCVAGVELDANCGTGEGGFQPGNDCGGGGGGGGSAARDLSKPSYTQFANKNVTITPGGTVKLKRPKTPAEASAMLQSMNSVLDEAMKDFEVAQSLPENDAKRVGASLRFVHVTQQHQRAIAMARPLARQGAVT